MNETTKQCPVCFGFGFVKHEDGARTVCEECGGDGEIEDRDGELDKTGDTDAE